MPGATSRSTRGKKSGFTSYMRLLLFPPQVWGPSGMNGCILLHILQRLHRTLGPVLNISFWRSNTHPTLQLTSSRYVRPTAFNNLYPQSATMPFHRTVGPVPKSCCWRFPTRPVPQVTPSDDVWEHDVEFSAISKHALDELCSSNIPWILQDLVVKVIA